MQYEVLTVLTTRSGMGFENLPDYLYISFDNSLRKHSILQKSIDSKK